MPINHAKEYLIFVHMGVVFLDFLPRASNGRQYSNFENLSMSKNEILRTISCIDFVKIWVNKDFM